MGPPSVYGTGRLSAVGPVWLWKEGDLVSPDITQHSQAIGFGLDVKLMMAEFLTRNRLLQG